jgi:cytochrome c
MKQFVIIVGIIVLGLMNSCKRESTNGRVLVFSKTAGYRHESIGEGKIALIELGKKNGFEVDTTENSAYFNEDTLKHYRAVIFLSTTQNVLDPVQQADFKRFIEAGGGFVGIHAAADTEYEWPWYGKLVGAYFKSHPQIQEAKLNKVKAFGQNKLPEVWTRTDEWYNYKNISKDINVIYSLDESSYKGGQNGNDHPIAWYHEFEGGRSFYTGLGHTKESYHDSLYLNHVLQGIQYAIGEDEPDYDKVKSKRAVEENRFSKTVLDFNLNEPTEMAILPNGDIIFLERKGAIKYFDQKIGKTEVISTLEVSTKYNKNAKGEIREAEDGVLGVALDPDFKNNHWVYIYYAPKGEEPKNVLSRFVLNDKKLDLASEKVVLTVPVQRDQCCHTGGSIVFDTKGNLFLSTGDNTNPFESNGFSPSDERPGRSPFDAQQSSGNTNDLRGKILRIHPEPDGTYTIPEGNLFPKGEPKTRPEIYVMGNRNPYRIAFDEKTGYLYWGEVGPDAGENDSLRGPRGYDEINQAKKAGFFGWPYFIGPNYAYAKYDFEKGTVGQPRDPEKPLNQSPNNTGKEVLPPANPAYIWYPYDKSDEFPMVKTGGRNAMAGPVYYSDKYNGVSTAFPDYFDGKVFVYDWMRNWMFHITTDKDGAILDMEPFMPNTKFNNIIDMSYGPDGRLYMLEYGTAWFKQNIDARLVRIDYNSGNRPPVAELKADKIAGSIPLTVTFTTDGTKDYDGDKLSYELQYSGQKVTSDDGNFKVTFDKPGVQTVKLVVTDKGGATGTTQINITAGNETPKVSIDASKGNQTFYFPGTPIVYNVKVEDHEDGSTEDKKINAADVRVTFDFLKGFDMAGIIQGHQIVMAELPGKALIEKSDCKSCHILNQKSAGPSYQDVALKYKDQPGAVDKLAEKIIRGGSGVWGTTEMSAHPQVSVDDVRKMVEYILTLGDDKTTLLPIAGRATPEKQTGGAYVLKASYTDKGGANVPKLSDETAKVYREPKLGPSEASEMRGPRVARRPMLALDNIRHNSFAMYKNIDLSQIKRVVANAYIDPAKEVGGTFELRLDKPDGVLWGGGKLQGKQAVKADVKVEPTTGFHDVFIVFKNPDAGDKPLYHFGGVDLINK